MVRLGVMFGRSVSSLASVGWNLFQVVNRRIAENVVHPKWAPGPMLKSRERTFPQLGWPRETDSLCPGCVKEVRGAIVNGEMDYRVLVEGNPGEIRARIVERDGKILMEKDCAKHGHYEDVMSIDPSFMERIEQLYPGRDFKMAPDPWHNHGSSTVKFGRGAVLTIDLTNRCNMMCEPCFMDANQVGYVHELTWEEIKQLLDNSAQVKPRRQMSVQFSGGEPTLSPYFLDSIAYARKTGYMSVQCASNGIRFAQEPDFCAAAKRAGLRFVYLQFDGTTNESNSHRKVGNLFEVKQKAIDNLHEAGLDIVLVTTVVNTVNNDQVGPIVRFLADNIDKVIACSFQPVSFTGRDDEISEDDRVKYRYTLSHLAHDLNAQLGITEPMRDWYPLSATGPFSDFLDHMQGSDAQWGTVKCGCHPNCGIGTMMLINRRTKQMVPLPQVLDVDQFLQDLKVITDTARGRKVTLLQTALAFLRNYRFDHAPKGLGLMDLVRVIDGYNGAKMGIGTQMRYEWRMAMVAGMWFQDLFNYDFRRTEMCIIPYATQAGEISFCAYNTGVGWRQVVEKIFQTATTTQWFKAMGKHAVYAGGKNVPMPQLELKNAPAKPAPATIKSDLPMFVTAPASRSSSPDSEAYAFDPTGNQGMSPFNSPLPKSIVGAGCSSGGCGDH